MKSIKKILVLVMLLSFWGIGGFTSKVEAAIDGTTFKTPAQGRITSGFSASRPDGRTHRGVDIANITGTAVLAANDGVVSRTSKEGALGGYGNFIMITHTVDQRTFTTLYAHLNSINVQKGQQVKLGQSIGKMGNTGISSGPHLHFELHFGAYSGFGPSAVNPVNYTGDWLKSGNQWVYKYLDGTTHRGWKKDGKLWYYLDDSSGIMKTGWQQINGQWYFLSKNTNEPQGAMKTGWIQDDGKWYYLDPTSGAMKTGWQLVNGKWYFLSENTGDPKGSMKTGWITHGIYDYYLGTDGAMFVGTHVIDGVTYTFNSNGQLVK